MSVHVSSNVWRSCPQRRDSLILMLALADLCTDEGSCYATIKELAARCRSSERNAQRLIQGLIDDGEIDRIMAAGGRGRAPVYLLARYSEGGLCTTFGKGDKSDQRVTNHPVKGDSPTEQSVSQRKDTTVRTSEKEQVVNIYDAYPKKVGRPAAVKAIARALKHNSFNRLHELTLKYAEAVKGADLQFIPHPATWFNQERYNDDPKTWTRSDRRDRTESSRNVGTANEGKSSQYAGVGKVR
jgi:hypothetical protein